MAREDARTAVRCTVFAFSPPCTRSPGFEVGNERERGYSERSLCQQQHQRQDCQRRAREQEESQATERERKEKKKK